MLLQDIDCVMDSTKKTDLTKPGELPLGKDTSKGSSSSTVKTVVSHFLKIWIIFAKNLIGL